MRSRRSNMMNRLKFILTFCAIGTVTLASSAQDLVLVEICEQDIPKDGTWPVNTTYAESYTEFAFALVELPQKYVSTGVRADRAFPTLVRASGRVSLPPGKHRLLLRSRGAARLLIDGQKVLETPFDQPRQFDLGNGGELPVEEQNTYINLGPGYRFAPPGNREVMGEALFSGTPATVVLETLIGGLEPKSKSPFRPELGETVVAVALEGTNEWRLLSPGTASIPYTDAAWVEYESGQRTRIAVANAAARAARRSEHGAYWDRRREVGRSWLATTPDVEVPPLAAGFPELNSIDRFIAARIAEVAEISTPSTAVGRVDYHREVQPILESRCYDCHKGPKAKGGLRLDLRSGALLGGKADGPAIVPHQPEASAMLARIASDDSEEAMPAKGDPLTAAEIALLRRWIEEGAVWPDFPPDQLTLTPLSDDLTFLRRVTLDTVGVAPSESEVAAFLSDRSPDRRTRVIDRLLGDSRWADHNMGYWLDVLAENPNLINPTLNNTGPFRWWLYESFLDNKPLDLFVTELIRLEGSERFGGPAGFGVATQNDVPMAAKGVIVGSAFLGVEMKCARCHDSPTHAWKQRDLFELAAMLETRPIQVPGTSNPPMDHLRLGGRQPLIELTLHAGTTVQPAWPFAQFCDVQTAIAIAEDPDNSRDRLAALITAPQNERFAQVMVNRIWQRLMGRGLVEQVGDWEMAEPSHPELLRWLGRELVRSGYNAKAVTRLILTSHAYQRAADPTLRATGPFFAAPAPRPIGAEQLVDSLFAAAGVPFDLEPINLDVDSVRTIGNALDLGRARRAWMLASTSNERDRPSLALPRIHAVAEVMEAFGWRGARPDPAPGVREVEANVLQPALLSNGVMMTWLTSLGERHGLTSFALEERPVDSFIDQLFLRILTRPPTAEEQSRYVDALRPGYATRVVAGAVATPTEPDPVRRKFVAWSNHMKSEANTLRLEEAAAARRGPPPTHRLNADWRRRFEDVIWALFNAPEWTHIL
jgi:mono/diheme cytochrome c family protein